MKRAIALGVTLFFVAACGGDSNPNAPSNSQTLNVSGIWSGTYSSSQLGFGRATLSLSQGGTVVSGTWSTSPDAGGGSGAGSGTISGTMTATGTSGTFTLTMSPSDPRTCPFSSTMTAFLAQRQMTGQWVTFNCTVAASGGLILTKI